jgi:hypothetical protein
MIMFSTISRSNVPGNVMLRKTVIVEAVLRHVKLRLIDFPALSIEKPHKCLSNGLKTIETASGTTNSDCDVSNGNPEACEISHEKRQI